MCIRDRPEPICVVAPAGHPLAGQAEVTLQELAGQEFLLTERGMSYRDADVYKRQTLESRASTYARFFGIVRCRSQRSTPSSDTVRFKGKKERFSS